MSIVAWDGKTLAADRQATNHEMRIACKKIFRLNSGLVVAFTGDLDQGHILLNWYEEGGDPEKWPAFQRTNDWTRLIVADHEGVMIYEKEPEPMTFRESFLAWGSGRDFAMGAMAAGATAVEAVEIASRFNVHCGCGVDFFELTPA